MLLWHAHEPVGICVFSTPCLSLAPRNRFFGLPGRRAGLNAKALNRQLVVLSRVVLHPTYRGAGIAAAFVRRSCELCPEPWIETLTEMGRLNPFFERAGFVRVGEVSGRKRSRKGHTGIYGLADRARGKKGSRPVVLSEETHRKSRYATPVYYVFDNRRR